MDVLRVKHVLSVACALVLCTMFSGIADAGEPALTITAGSKSTARVELNNNVPVRGLQFTVTGAKVTEVRTTSRSKEFIAKFNEKNGMVLMVSTSAATIAPGSGPVAEVVCDTPQSAGIAGEIVVTADRKNQ